MSVTHATTLGAFIDNPSVGVSKNVWNQDHTVEFDRGYISTIPPWVSDGNAGFNTGANVAQYVQLEPLVNDVAITTAAFYLGTASGNACIAILSVTSGSPPTRTITRQATTGSFDVSTGGGAIKTASLSLTLNAGTIYYVGFVFDNSTATVAGITPANGLYVLNADRNIACTKSSSFPIPSSAVLAAGDQTNLLPQVFLY